MVDLDVLELNYFVNMSNVPYELKKGGMIYIKPVLLEDYLRYNWAKEILTINKNEINDIEVIQMSYLEFLIKRIFSMDKSLEDKVRWIIKLCLDEDYVAIGDNCLIVCDKDGTIKYVISSKEFDDISKIIQAQNDPNYDDRYVSPEVKELMRDYYKVKYKDDFSLKYVVKYITGLLPLTIEHPLTFVPVNASAIHKIIPYELSKLINLSLLKGFKLSLKAAASSGFSP